MPLTSRASSCPRERRTLHALNGIVATRDVDSADVPTGTAIDWAGVSLTHACRVQEDFLQAAGGTLPAPWAKQDTSAAGSPTLDYVDDAANGAFTLASDSQAEAQKLTLYFGDQLVVDVAKQPLFEARVKLDVDTALTADDLFVVGLASARAADLDTIATHAWFRVEADLDILFESDDGTTDDDDNDSGVNLTDGAYAKLAIDFADLSAVAFYVDIEDGNGFVKVGTTDMSDATGNLQPFVELQVGAAETHAITVDYATVAWMR